MFHWNRSSGSGGRIQRGGRGNREWQDDGEPERGCDGGRTENGTDRGCLDAECPPYWPSGYLMSLSSSWPRSSLSQQTLTPSTLDWPQSDFLFSMPRCFWPQCLIGWIFGKKAAYEMSAEHRKHEAVWSGSLSLSLCQYIHLSHLSCWVSPLPLLIRLLLRHVIWEGTWWWKKKKKSPGSLTQRWTRRLLWQIAATRAFHFICEKRVPPTPTPSHLPVFFFPFFNALSFTANEKGSSPVLLTCVMRVRCGCLSTFLPLMYVMIVYLYGAHLWDKGEL